MPKGQFIRLRTSPESRFWKYIMPEPNSDCWLWIGATSSAGYGQIGDHDRKIIYAHRLSWQMHRGEIPDGLHVLHKCDNPPCCNPDHLFIGNQKTNQMDSASKGRKAFLNKLDRAAVEQAENMRMAGMLQREIGERLGVTQGAISRLLNGISHARRK